MPISRAFLAASLLACLVLAHSQETARLRLQTRPVFFVGGSVKRPGGYPLKDGKAISVLQALAAAGGKTRYASRSSASIIHWNPDGSRAERKVNLERIQNGQDPDVSLQPNNVLFIPGGISKEAVLRGIERGQVFERTP